MWWRRRPFPWLGDALVTLPWFIDTLGNWLDLFDTVDFFDDWMHFMNWALLTAGVLVLTLPATTRLKAVVERALAFGVTVALGWELAEYRRVHPDVARAGHGVHGHARRPVDGVARGDRGCPGDRLAVASRGVADLAASRLTSVGEPVGRSVGRRHGDGG